VVAGIVTPEDAKGIAVEVGTALNDQQLAINASSQIVELYDSEGNLIVGNLLKLQAEIKATMDRQTAEQLYDDQANAFMRFRDLITGGETKEIAIDNMLIEETSEGVANSLSLAADSVEQLRTSYASGNMDLKEYKENMEALRSSTKGAVSEGLEKLGVTFEDLQEKAGDKSLFDFKGTYSQLNKAEKEALDVIKNTSNNAKNILEDVLGKDASAGLMQYIKEDLTGGDVQAASEVFSQIVAGDVEPSTLNALIAAIDDPILRQKLRDLFNIPITVSAEGQFGNYYDGTKKSIEGATGAAEDYSATIEDTTTKEKSRIQTLEESLALTKQQTLATQYLITRGLKPEALASLDAATAVDIMNGKRTDLIKKLNEQATAQRLIAVLGKLAEDREIDRLDLESRVADQRINGIQKQIDAVERQNELDQRQVSIRQKALDDISKKEDALNQQYDARFTALDKVARINDRLAQQERSRISLASALSSGDIGSAVFAASEMTRSFAESQAEDARSSLEYMREQELSNITANVNGQFLTREQIQAQIDGINERIYQRQLSTIPLEDQLYAYNQEKERIANRIEQIQINMQAKQIEEEQALARQLGLLKGKKRYARDIRDYYAQAVSLMNSLGGRAVTAMYGGSIQKKAFGGLLKYTSNEPAPGMAMGGRVKKFAIGNIVPGMGNVDRVPALLTPGEFVVRKSVAQANMPLLQALNSDVFPTMSGGVPSVDPGSLVSNSIVTNNTPVYNYSISVNVPNTNASPEEIANVVASRLNRINSTSIRGGRRIG
jgi:hypothetical protein